MNCQVVHVISIYLRDFDGNDIHDKHIFDSMDKAAGYVQNHKRLWNDKCEILDYGTL